MNSVPISKKRGSRGKDNPVTTEAASASFVVVGASPLLYEAIFG